MYSRAWILDAALLEAMNVLQVRTTSSSSSLSGAPSPEHGSLGLITLNEILATLLVAQGSFPFLFPFSENNPVCQSALLAGMKE